MDENIGLNVLNRHKKSHKKNKKQTNQTDYFKDIIQNLENQIEEKNEQIMELEENNEALIQQLESNQIKMDTQRNKLFLVKQNQDSLLEELDELKRQNLNLEGQLEEHKAETRQQIVQIESKRSIETNNLESNLDSIIKEKETLILEVEQLRTKNGVLKKQISDLDAQNK